MTATFQVMPSKAPRTPKSIMDAAKGELCTFQMAGTCNHDRETTVACHLPDGSGGSNRLNGPLYVAFGCSDCHDRLDGRAGPSLLGEDKWFYIARAHKRTEERLRQLGIIEVKGL